MQNSALYGTLFCFLNFPKGKLNKLCWKKNEMQLCLQSFHVNAGLSQQSLLFPLDGQSEDTHLLVKLSFSVIPS